MTMLLTGRSVRGAGIGDDRESRFPRLAADSPFTVSSAAAEARAEVGSRAHLIIDPEGIGANTRLFVARARGAVMAVGKADGFGHGAELVAAAALANGATWLGVTSLAEALALRRAGFVAPTLTWLNPVDADFGAAIDLDVDVAVCPAWSTSRRWQPRLLPCDDGPACICMSTAGWLAMVRCPGCGASCANALRPCGAGASSRSWA
jgi:Alanine racemase, N-terminal domain